MAGRKRVLVVDDHPDTVDVLCRSLEQRGYTTIPAYNGAEAIEKARSEPVDCVLLDIMMPGCSGLKVCHELKHQPATKHLPVVILSAKKEPQDISYAKQLGADDYLTKPISLNRLLRALEAHTLASKPEAPIVPGQTVLLIGSDGQLAQDAQNVLDKERVGGKDWLRLVPVASCERAIEMIAEDAPRAVVIDARGQAREAAQLCRRLKMAPDTKHVVVIALLENAADDIKFAWANECLIAPAEPSALANAIRNHLKR